MSQSKVEWEGGHYQGDIDTSNEKDDELPKITYFNAVPKELKWPNNTMYYSIDEKSYDMEQIDNIEEAAKEIMNRTDCIYIFRVPKGTKENYLSIEPSGICSSFVGMVGGEQRLSLTKPCMFNRGTILHEFMHALGFHHEQCRGNRNDHVIVQWDNIPEENWSAFNKVAESHSAPYDYESVLHFGPKCFVKESSKDSLTLKDRSKQIGQRRGLSDMDVERMQILYDHLKPEDSVHFRDVNLKDLYRQANWTPKVADLSKRKT